MQDLLYHNSDVPSISVVSDSRGLIHPTLRPHLLGIAFQNLSSDDVSRIFGNKAENILRDFVRNAREQGVFK